MSYLVLARKYRPQTFADIVGQEHVTQTLQNAFLRGRVHHAFLFCGARGVGKTTAARVLAKALCCEQGVGQVCNGCTACTTITDGTAVDYHEIDGASNNGVDDIRELRDGVRYQPAQLRRKIYVIDEVHMLSVAAFNALLKTLEEPPPHVTFIFATTEVHKIPVTILSRCQRYDFKLVPTARLSAHLEAILGKEGIAVDKGALALLAREAGGSVRDSLSLTDQVIAYTGGESITEARVAEVLGVADRGLLVELLRAVVGGDVRATLAAVVAASDRGVDLAHLARTFLALLRDVAVVTEVRDPTGLVDLSPDEIAALRGVVQGVARVQLLALFERFARACEDMAKSPTPRLVLEVALLDMAGSEPLQAVSDLIERLEQMERRLAGGGGPPPRAGGPGGGGARPAAPARSMPPGPMATGPSPGPGPVASAAVAAVPMAAPVVAASAFTASAAAVAAVPSPAPAAVAPPMAVAPAPAPSPAGARTPADPMAEWERAISAMEVMLGGIYSHARLLDWVDGRIELGFARGSLQGSLGTDAGNLAKVGKFISNLLGSPVEVRAKEIAHMPDPRPPAAAPAGGPAPAAAPSNGGSATVAELEAERKRADREKREAEARQHPITKAAIDTFGAVIKEIKIDG